VPLNNWTLRFFNANGQNIYDLWQGVIDLQEDGHVAVENDDTNARLNPGQTATFGFNATRGATNSAPALFNLNSVNCSRTIVP
jgi:mannan endo-1,4-beta-mannosidase